MSDCVFCRMFTGEEPHVEVDSGMNWKAIVPLNPVVPGHVLFIPERHAERLEGLDADLNDLIWGMKYYATAVGGDWNLIQSNGSAATQTIRHVHFHFVPRRKSDGLMLPWSALPAEVGA